MDWTKKKKKKVIQKKAKNPSSLPGLPEVPLLACAGVGADGRTGAGEPWPVAWAGVGFPGRMPLAEWPTSLYTVKK